MARRIFAILAAAAVLAACGKGIPEGNLAAAQSLGAAATAARSSYALLANDFQGSCERTYRWTRLTFAEQAHLAAGRQQAVASSSAQLDSLAQRLASAATAADRASILATIQSIKAQLPSLPAARIAPTPQDNCNDPEVIAAVTAWNGWNNLLLNLFVAFGNLAAPPATDAFGLNATATSIASEVKGDPRFGPQADEIAKLATTVFTAVIKAKQSKAVAQYASPATTALVTRTIAALRSVETIYVSSELFNEDGALDTFYRNNLDAVPAGAPILGDLQTFLTAWNSDLAALAQRRTAAQSYVSSLQTLANAYAAVVSTSAAKPAQSSTIYQYLLQLQPNLTAIDKAFVK